ncbi:protein kinase [Bacillus sp. SM-B1]|uniref:protein kinase domain-containing protein n=1 Tax=Bacillus sp. SM-B1 TaxID=2980102 RepID=UPI0029498B4D|nr:protein kinase [Bacillus sp. SM-B1]MDV6039291.1 protein kinase [Bacillus sp. SM-B1]
MVKKKENRGIVFDEKTRKLYINNQESIIKNVEIEDFISTDGANGFVFEGENTLTGRKIALKIWTPRRGFDFPDIKRFNAEIRKNSKYRNDKIVQIYSAGEVNDYFYAEMEYVDGETLHDWLNKWSRNFIERKKVLDQILEGIKVVHDGNDYHGDLHTKNVLVTEYREVKILDLGTSVFSGANSSHEREARLLFQTGRSLLKREMEEYNYLDSDLIRNPIKFPPEIVREFLDGISNIIWSLKYDLASDNNFLLSDLSVYFCKTPIFDLPKFAEYLHKNFSEEELNSFLSSLHHLLAFIIAVFNTKFDRNPSFTDFNDILSEGTKSLYDTARDMCLKDAKLYLECFNFAKMELTIY